MTTTNESVTTPPELTDESEWAGFLYRFWTPSNIQGSCGFGFDHKFLDSDYAAGEVLARSLDNYYLVSLPSRGSTELITYVPKIRQYGEGPNAIIVVDFEEPETEFDGDQLEAVRFLRSNGREVLASKLVEMLRNAEEDGRTVNIVSLRDMVRLMVRCQRLADPFVSPDDYGIVYAQWQTEGNGLVVISFPGGEEIVLTAQADAVPGLEELDISEQGNMHGVMRKYGHLVPHRN